MVNKFDEAHNGLVSIVLTSLLPYMSIVTLTSKINRVHPRTMAYTCMSAKSDKEAHNGLVSIVFTSFHISQLWPWPLTSKINRVHPLIIVNMSAKFAEEAHNGLVSIMFTRSTHKGCTHTWNTAVLLHVYSHHNAMGGDNNKSCQKTTTLAGRQPSLNGKLQSQGQILVPCERSCHKEYTCAIWNPYLFWFENYGQG